MIQPGTPGQTLALKGHWDYNPLIVAFIFFAKKEKV
jgi:hypothetical protein